jgi:hypothetical protein
MNLATNQDAVSLDRISNNSECVYWCLLPCCLGKIGVDGVMRSSTLKGNCLFSRKFHDNGVDYFSNEIKIGCNVF